MVEHTEFLSVVHDTVSKSKEKAVMLQDEIVRATNDEITISVNQAHLISSLLRIQANLVTGLLEENSQILDQLTSALQRLQK